MAGDKGIAHKEFVLAGHTWWCFIATAWKYAKTSPQTLVIELIVAIQHDCYCLPTLLTWPGPTLCDFHLFSELKIKLKGHNFDTIEVVEAESQVVLDVLTEHCFCDAFK
jgi:hypothetical protein